MSRGLLVMLAWAFPVTAQNGAAILERAETSYGAVTSLTAEFAQTIINPMLGGPEHSKGYVYLLPPDRFAMRFTDPPGDRIVADGTWLWAYAPSSVPNQVIRQPIPRAGAITPNLVAQFVDRPLERYTATHVGVDTVDGRVVDVFRLLPIRPVLPFQDAEIAIARPDALLRRIAFTEVSGQRRVIILRAIRTDVEIPPRELRFDVPSGTRVVEP